MSVNLHVKVTESILSRQEFSRERATNVDDLHPRVEWHCPQQSSVAGTGTPGCGAWRMDGTCAVAICPNILLACPADRKYWPILKTAWSIYCLLAMSVVLRVILAEVSEKVTNKQTNSVAFSPQENYTA
jgi:hypothetical protein